MQRRRLVPTWFAIGLGRHRPKRANARFTRVSRGVTPKIQVVVSFFLVAGDGHAEPGEEIGTPLVHRVYDWDGRLAKAGQCTGGTGENFKTRIDVLELEETLAVVRVLEEGWGGKIDFTDVLLLLKIDGKWKCVAKAYNQNSNTIEK